jgi:acetolactate synthase-1/2/3 large subunit
MNGTEAIARILKKEGIEWISCFPSNPVIEALAKESIRPIAFRHERGGMMAADGFSRMNDRNQFGVFAMQNQAGAENSMGGVSQAFADNIPVLVLPGAPALHRINIRPEFSAVDTFRNVLKYGELVNKADQIPDVMRRAFHHLRNGRPGPVMIELPSDVGAEELSVDINSYHSPTKNIQIPSNSSIKDTVAALLKAKNPIIWSGMGVLFSQATDELKELAELLSLPVYTTMPGKSGFDETHPLSLGAGSGATTAAAVKWLNESDLILALGTSLTRTPYARTIPEGKIIIHNVVSVEDINKDYNVDISLPGDTKETIKLLLDEIKSQVGEKGKQKPELIKEIQSVKSKWLEQWLPILTDNEGPINPYRLIWELDQTVDKNKSVVTHDAGAPRDMMVPFYNATTPHGYVGWGKTTHLGFGIPLMIGVKKAFPDKFCVNFMGDGAFGMSGLDLETSVRSGLPITTILLNNGGMATYPGGFPTAREVYGVSHMFGEYWKIAEGMGATGIKITKPSEIKPALIKAQQLNSEGKTVLIDAHTKHADQRSN